MGMRYRKSINLGGGVKLNLNKKSVGVSAGTKHMRYTVNSSGRRTTSVGAPGTGMSWRQTSSSPQRTARRRSPTTSAPAAASVTGRQGSRGDGSSRGGFAATLIVMLKAIVWIVKMLFALIYAVFKHAWPTFRAFFTNPDPAIRRRRKFVTTCSVLGFFLLGVVVMLVQTLYTGASMYLLLAAATGGYLFKQHRDGTRAGHALIADRADDQHSAWLNGDPHGLYGDTLPPI